MEVAARLTSKGQITIPKAVRDALGLADGDAVVFRIDGSADSLRGVRISWNSQGRSPFPLRSGAFRGTKFDAAPGRPEQPRGGERLCRHEHPHPPSHRRPR